MNRRCSAIAVSVLALGAAAPGATVASPQVDPTTPQCQYANHPVCELAPAEAVFVQSTATEDGLEALPMGASALGGAAFAFAGMWLYRRRHVPAI